MPENNLKQRLIDDVKNAMKAGDAITVGVLRMINASIQNKEIDLVAKKKKMGDEEILQILNTELKKRREAAEIYQKGGRPELAEKELAEMQIIKKYLPEQLGEKEISKAIDACIAKSSKKEFGIIMKEIMKELKGKADASLISKLLKEKLGA